MNVLADKFKSSAKELKKTQSLSICAMMLALRVVCGALENTGLGVMSFAKIPLNFLPVAIVAILFGPMCAMIINGLGDILSFIIVPMGYYFPGWTLNAVLIGLMYGIFIYRSKHFVLNVIICEILIALLIEIPLGTLWLHLTYGKAFWITASARGIVTLISAPIETLVIIFVMNILKKTPSIKIN